MSGWYRRDEASCWLLQLHVQPGAKRSEIAGLHGESLKVRLAAPPVEGRANAALLKLFARLFGVPQRNVELAQGASSRHKALRICGSVIDPASLLPKQEP